MRRIDLSQEAFIRIILFLWGFGIGVLTTVIISR